MGISVVATEMCLFVHHPPCEEANFSARDIQCSQDFLDRFWDGRSQIAPAANVMHLFETEGFKLCRKIELPLEKLVT